ncbi:MAG: CDP-alcohol phosphatidyltransferase family protein [Gemmatimonadales bacterium]|nr:MAG: CDP-alcohol phosphatidyltransferase family protein [Gemmatimonadales bacterium]
MLLAGVTGWIQQDAAALVIGGSLALYLVQGALLLGFAPGLLPGGELGPANRLTLLRSSLVFPIAALLPIWADLGSPTTWWVIVLASVALVLDGLDGKVARMTDSHTSFGARFDMELDAFLILVLSMGVWLGGRAGAWVLLVGLLRYLFVVAGWLWPRLTAPLPESRRRKVVCVVQGVALLVALGPIIPASLAVASAALGLAALVYSFGVDTVWLVRHGEESRSSRSPGTGA